MSCNGMQKCGKISVCTEGEGRDDLTLTWKRGSYGKENLVKAGD